MLHQLQRATDPLVHVEERSEGPLRLPALSDGVILTDSQGGAFSAGDSSPFSSLNGVSALVAGAVHSLVFSQKGSLLVFGSNDSGRLSLVGSHQEKNPVHSNLQLALPPSAHRSKKKSAHSSFDALSRSACHDLGEDSVLFCQMILRSLFSHKQFCTFHP